MFKMWTTNNKLIIVFDEITGRCKHMFDTLFSYVIRKNIDTIHIIPSHDITFNDCIISLITHNILRYRNNIRIIIHINEDSDTYGYYNIENYYYDKIKLTDLRFSNDRKPIYFRCGNSKYYKITIGNINGVSISMVNKNSIKEK